MTVPVDRAPIFREPVGQCRRAMAGTKLILALLLIAGLEEAHGHGKLMDPVSRSSAWRKGFETPPNYTDNELSCGGVGTQRANGGKCGPCGDDYRQPRPRANENGGTYGTGTIVKRYRRGGRASVVVNLSANHIGYFEFALCPLDSAAAAGQALESEECFARHPLRLAGGGGYRYRVPVGKNGDYRIDVLLPEGLACRHCAFRWHYQTGNSWGVCENGGGALGCGPQEQFRGCADVSIS